MLVHGPTYLGSFPLLDFPTAGKVMISQSDDKSRSTDVVTMAPRPILVCQGKMASLGPWTNIASVIREFRMVSNASEG